MKNSHFTKLLLGVAIAGAALAIPAVASAQATRTWVSGVGDDANPCSRTAPCKTFAGALPKTATKGEINCLDPGGFGTVTITKSITIACKHTLGGVLATGATGVIVNSATATVILRGLDINGVGIGFVGIRVIAAKRVNVYDTDIYGFTRNGFEFQPSNANAKALLQNTTIEDNLGNGVLVAPTSTGNNGRVTITDSTITGNGCGVTVTNHSLDTALNYGLNCGTLTTGVGGSANATIIDSLITDHDATSGASGSTAVFTNGQNSVARIGGNLITGNINGLRAIDVGFGGIFSFGDNYINGNATNGTPTGAIPPS